MEKALKISPKNYLNDWGEFEDWENGANDTPTGWLKSGTPTITRESTTIKFGTYGLKMVGTSTGQKIYRLIPDGDTYKGRTFILSGYIKTSGAGVTIAMDDGVTVNSSSAHTGGNAWELISVTAKLDASGTKLQVNINVPNGVTAYYDSFTLFEGETSFKYFDTGNNSIEKTFNPKTDVSADSYEIARRAGVLVPEVTFRGKKITIKGNVRGASLSECRDNLDAFIKGLYSWDTSKMRELYVYDDRVYEVFLDGTINIDNLNFIPVKKYSIDFMSQNPSSRYISMKRKSQVTAGVTVEFNIPYLGNFESKPIVSFCSNRGVGATIFTLENLTTGDILSFNAEVAAGNTLEINCDLMTVKNAGVDAIANFPGDFLRLVEGTNYLRAAGSSYTISIDYFERWL